MNPGNNPENARDQALSNPNLNRLLGITLVILSAASFGTLAIFGRLAYTAGVDVYTFLCLRFSLSALIMSGMMAWRRETWPSGRILLQLVGMGALGYAGQSFCYMMAIQFASPGLVALLLYLYPFFVALLASLFLREKLTRLKTLALGLALTGTALTVSPEGGQLPGIGFAILAAVIYSVYIIVGAGVMQKVTPFQSSTVIFAAAGGVYGLIVLINGPQFPANPGGWTAIAGTVALATVIPVVAFLEGLKRIGPTNASMLSTLEPVVTVILSALIFAEQLHTLTLIGGGLILGAVILLTQSELRQGHAAIPANPGQLTSNGEEG